MSKVVTVKSGRKVKRCKRCNVTALTPAAFDAHLNHHVAPLAAPPETSVGAVLIAA